MERKNIFIILGIVLLLFIINNSSKKTVCADDMDCDGVFDNVDNCPYDYNPTQTDGDMDGIGDWCDGCQPNDADSNCDNCVSKTEVLSHISKWLNGGITKTRVLEGISAWLESSGC